MKHNYTSTLRRALSAVVLLLCVSTLSWAQDFESGGIRYSINEDGESVTATGYTQECSGDVAIPSAVVHEDKTYSVTGIGEEAFMDCTSLTSVEIPDGVTSIARAAFGDCTSLASVDFPGGLTSIGMAAFYGCSSLTSIDLPGGLTGIERNAFNRCTSLTSVTCRAEVAPKCNGMYVFDYTAAAAATLYVPASALSAYKGAYMWKNFGTILPIGIFEAEFIRYRINEDAEGVTVIGYAQACSGDVAIPSTVAHAGKTYSVTGIGAGAFMDCTSITSVSLPEGLTGIEVNTFYGCSSLTSINLPEGVTSIGSSAFGGCSSLASINLPEGVTSIGSSAFRGCSSLSSVTVSAGNPVYDSREGCNAIIETETNTLITGCRSTVIPSSVTSIGEGAFYGCTSLTSLDIPKGVTEIGEHAFDGCTSLTSVTVSAGNPVYDSREGCNAIIKTETNTLVVGCSGTVIPSSVTGIGERAFYDCTSLTSIDIPSSVTGIGERAFYGCTSLATVVCRAEEVPECGYKAFGSNGIPTVEMTLYVPASALEAYRQSSAWRWYFSVMLPIMDFEAGGLYYLINEDKESVSVGDVAPECSGDVVIPSTVVHEGKTYRVTGIREYAFDKCTPLTSVSIPEGVTGIGNSAFSGCTSLASIDLPGSLTSIGKYAFEKCTSLTSASIPDGVTDIGRAAFSGCTALASVSIPDGVTGIGVSAFDGCTSLASIDLPDGLTRIEDNTFYGCSSLTSVSIPDGVTGIGGSAFYGCTSLTTIDLPDALTRIENYTFGSCRSLTSIDLPGSLTSIGQHAFSGCRSLASIDFPAGLTRIEWDAFDFCTSLTTVKCRAEAVPVCGYSESNNGSVFVGTPIAEATLYVPASALEDYKAANQWKDFGTILPIEDYETGIDTPASPQESGTGAAPYYTLDGRRVAAPVRGGIYIRNGRKVIVR